MGTPADIETMAKGLRFQGDRRPGSVVLVIAAMLGGPGCEPRRTTPSQPNAAGGVCGVALLLPRLGLAGRRGRGPGGANRGLDLPAGARRRIPTRSGPRRGIRSGCGPREHRPVTDRSNSRSTRCQRQLDAASRATRAHGSRARPSGSHRTIVCARSCCACQKHTGGTAHRGLSRRARRSDQLTAICRPEMGSRPPCSSRSWWRILRRSAALPCASWRGADSVQLYVDPGSRLYAAGQCMANFRSDLLALGEQARRRGADLHAADRSARGTPRRRALGPGSDVLFHIQAIGSVPTRRWASIPLGSLLPGQRGCLLCPGSDQPGAFTFHRGPARRVVSRHRSSLLPGRFVTSAGDSGTWAWASRSACCTLASLSENPLARVRVFVRRADRSTVWITTVRGDFRRS